MQEPILNIGIVLSEDVRQRITVTLPQQRRYLWEIAGKCHELPAGASCTVSTAASGIRLEHEDRPIATGNGPAVMRACGDYPFAGNQCPLVRDITAGRSFHWRKQIDQLLPGQLQFARVGTSLVLSNRLPLEIYLQGVVSAEMNADCPLAFLQAQMVVARSWLLAAAENKHPGLDCCNDDCCQRYQGIGSVNAAVVEASRTTWGQVLCSGDSICDTRYSKCCGGITEQADQIWPDAGQPYLQSLVDAADATLLNFDPSINEAQLRQWLLTAPPCFCNSDTLPHGKLQYYLGRVDEPGSYFRWQQYYSSEQLAELLLKKLSLTDLERPLSLLPGARGKSGRLKQLTINYCSKQGRSEQHHLHGEYAIRNALHPSFLYSSAFVADAVYDHRKNLAGIWLRGGGWGHGVGLCQMGALNMAQRGYDYRQILSHYFSASYLKRVVENDNECNYDGR